MAWYLYDKKRLIGQVATYGGLRDIELLNITPLNRAIAGGVETEDDKQRVLTAIADYPELDYLAQMIEPAEVPLIFSDGADAAVHKFHANDPVTVMPPEDSIQSVADAKRVYKKYTGQDWQP